MSSRPGSQQCRLFGRAMTCRCPQCTECDIVAEGQHPGEQAGAVPVERDRVEEPGQYVGPVLAADEVKRELGGEEQLLTQEIDVAQLELLRDASPQSTDCTVGI